MAASGRTLYVAGMPSRRPRPRAIVLTVAALFAGIASVVACGTDPIGVEACRKIEKVRCESAPACNIKLDRPVHIGESAANDVAACIRYYDDQCLHGLTIKEEPAPADVDACVNAIIGGSCAIVEAPQTDPACAFLIPPERATAVDAAAEAAADASTSTIDAATDAPTD